MLYEMLYSFGHLVLSCCIVLYLVVWSLIVFDHDQTFSLNKCCTIQHFLCFQGCCMTLYSFGHPMQLYCTLLYSRVWRNVASCCTKCCIRLATPLLNTIKQLATICNKGCMMFSEMLYSFGRFLSFCCWKKGWYHQQKEKLTAANNCTILVM